MPNVQWKTPDDGQRNCPKHVEFLDKNKFGKLVRLLVLFKRKIINFSYEKEVKFKPEFTEFATNVARFVKQIKNT